ncbi:hypothetical protein NDU88_000883 [Pleurodeles waltl]|uniref:Uncharacterized protein n=1 Tax=Pleurodeles waltl TaxID=8319 RepID=A0AAV7S6G3_PLEWA|nr:hypothetical protein NDU88_000883 [Pleurodeles waltl]
MQTWRLQNAKVVEGLEQSTQYYFTENEGSVQSPVDLWEAYKATIREEILAGKVGERRQRKKRLVTLETELIALERQCATQQTQELKKLMNQTRVGIQYSNPREVCQQYLLRSKRLYEAGNKASKLLAWLTKKERSDSHIKEIRTAKGKLLRDSEEIMEKMAAQMEDFYKSHITILKTEIDSFLHDWPMKRLSAQHTADLEEEITKEEISVALGQLQKRKSLGPNGFPVEFFQKLGKGLIPHLHAALHHTVEVGELPPLYENCNDHPTTQTKPAQGRKGFLSPNLIVKC